MKNAHFKVTGKEFVYS